MAFKVLMRTGGVILIVLLFFLRACVLSNAVMHARRANYHSQTVNNGAYSTSPDYTYRSAAPPAVPDHSGWIMFNTTDAVTGVNTRHSRLAAAPIAAPNGAAPPVNILELREQGPKDHHIRFALQTPPSCPGLTSLHAVFGAKPPMTIAVKPVSGEPGCTLEVVEYASVLQALLFNDELTVRAGDGPDVSFAVAGLSWD